MNSLSSGSNCGSCHRSRRWRSPPILKTPPLVWPVKWRRNRVMPHLSSFKQRRMEAGVRLRQIRTRWTPHHRQGRVESGRNLLHRKGKWQPWNQEMWSNDTPPPQRDAVSAITQSNALWPGFTARRGRRESFQTRRRWANKAPERRCGGPT